MGAEDPAYQCMGVGEDAQGLPGVFLRKNVVETAQAALADNVARLGPLLTPPSVKVCGHLTRQSRVHFQHHDTFMLAYFHSSSRPELRVEFQGFEHQVKPWLPCAVASATRCTPVYCLAHGLLLPCESSPSLGGVSSCPSREAVRRGRNPSAPARVSRGFAGLMEA